jgi:hypothetical protein
VATHHFGRKGVQETPAGRFAAYFCGLYLGTFDTITQAGDCYDAAAKLYYKEFYAGT